MPEDTPKNTTKSCGIAIYGRQADKKKGKTARAGCDKWSCPTCSVSKQKKLMARAIHGLKTHQDRDWFFVTLTAPSWARGFEQSLKAWRSGYRSVYHAMKKAHKAYALSGDMMMIKVFERHKDGTLHCHIITDVNWQSRATRKSDKKKAPYVFMHTNYIKRKNGEGYYRSSFLADKCVLAKLGYIGECRPIKGDAEQLAWIIASYVAKYITQDKNSGNGHWPKYAHRVEFSSNWPALPPLIEDNPYAWMVATRPPILRDILDGFSIDDEAQIMPMLGF